MKVIHRDLKPENVLINSHGEVKVADFGVSKSVIGTYDKTSTFVGTMTHMSPERLERNFHSIKSDIWSLGIIVFEMLTGLLPFEISQRKPCDLMNLWSSGKKPILSFGLVPVSPELRDFIGLCLEPNEAKRASTDELLKHPFILNHLTLENEQVYGSVFMRETISLVLASRSKPVFSRVKIEEDLWKMNGMEEEAPTKGISDLSTTNEFDIREEDTILQE